TIRQLQVVVVGASNKSDPQQMTLVECIVPHNDLIPFIHGFLDGVSTVEFQDEVSRHWGFHFVLLIKHWFGTIVRPVEPVFFTTGLTRHIDLPKVNVDKVNTSHNVVCAVRRCLSWSVANK